MKRHHPRVHTGCHSGSYTRLHLIRLIRRAVALGLSAGGLLALLTGCSEEPAVIRVAEQHGLAYVPLAIMQVEGYLEEELEATGEASTRVEWIRTGNAATIREAMLAGRLDIGFMGIPPFLIGLDRGTEWRLVTGLSEAPLGLVTLREEYRSIEDLSPADRVALPQPGSIQHILLAMAADREFDDPRRFDDQLVSMGHPEGLSALLAGRDVAAHFTSPPFLFDALSEPGSTLLLDGREAFGGRFTFIIGVVAPEWPGDRREEVRVQAFLDALDRAVSRARMLQEQLRDESVAGDPDPLLERLAEFYTIDVAALRRQLQFPGMVYTRQVHGVERFVEHMDRYGYLDRDNITDYRSEAVE